MTLLDRYIIRQYLTNIAALVLIMAFFVVTIDASLHINRYWNIAGDLTSRGDEGSPFLKQLLWTPLVVLDLWWPRLLGLFNILLGLLLVCAMGFTCAQLVRHRELVAVLTSGQSLYRVARPVLLVALGFTLLQAMNQEFIMPRIAPLLSREPRDALQYTMGTTDVPLTDDGVGRLFYAEAFDPDRGTLKNVSIWERDQRGMALHRINASEAVWRDGGWSLRDPTLVPLMQDGDQTLEEPPSRIITDLDPTMLKVKRYARFGNHLSFSQTAEILRRLDAIGADSDDARAMRERVQRVSLGRISAMLSNLLTLTIAMSFFITRVPRNMVYQSVKCAPVAVVALVGGVLGAAIPLPGVPTALSVFLPVMILTPIAIAVVTHVRT